MLLVEEQYDSVSTEFYKERFMPKLLTNGCSITLGAEMGETTRTAKEGWSYQHCDTDYRYRERWSTKLAEKMGMEPINLSRGGGSNWRIWRTTQDYLLTNPVDFAVIQMTEASRWQMPISFDFLDRWNPTSTVSSFFDFTHGGIYGHADNGRGYEEYSNWNYGEYHQLRSFQNDHRPNDEMVDENHYSGMKQEIDGYFLFNDQFHNYFDFLRHVLYLHYMFESNDVPHLIVDMLESIVICTYMKDELERITKLPPEVMLEKYRANQYELTYVVDEYDPSKDKDYLIWFKYIKRSNMSEKFNNLYNKVVGAKWFDGHPYRNYFSRITRDCPREGMNSMYLGEMPKGHPNEECHSIFAERMYNEITRRKLL